MLLWVHWISLTHLDTSLLTNRTGNYLDPHGQLRLMVPWFLVISLTLLVSSEFNEPFSQIHWGAPVCRDVQRGFLHLDDFWTCGLPSPDSQCQGSLNIKQCDYLSFMTNPVKTVHLTTNLAFLRIVGVVLCILATWNFFQQMVVLLTLIWVSLDIYKLISAVAVYFWCKVHQCSNTVERHHSC